MPDPRFVGRQGVICERLHWASTLFFGLRAVLMDAVRCRRPAAAAAVVGMNGRKDGDHDFVCFEKLQRGGGGVHTFAFGARGLYRDV